MRVEREKRSVGGGCMGDSGVESGCVLRAAQVRAATIRAAQNNCYSVRWMPPVRLGEE